MLKSDNPFLAIARPGALESRFDFCIDAISIETMLADGKSVPDGMYLEAIGWFDPPLVTDDMLPLLRRELDEVSKRSGRPTTIGLTLSEIVHHIESSIRLSNLPLFRDGLVKRLRTRDRVREQDRAIKFHKWLVKRGRDQMAKFLYDEFRNHIGRNTHQIEFKPLGTLEVPLPGQSEAARALQLVHDVMSGMGLDPPSPARLRNLISENSTRFS